MKTPFNEAQEPFFNTYGLRRLDFVEIEDGWTYAFDMRAIRSGQIMSPANSIRVFKREGILPEAFEFVLAAPMLYKTLAACQQGLQHVLDAAEQMQHYLKAKKVNDKHVDFIVKSVNDALVMIVSALSVPVVGREESLKLAQSPLDPKGKAE